MLVKDAAFDAGGACIGVAHLSERARIAFLHLAHWATYHLNL
jgi:hypothetical protein